MNKPNKTKTNADWRTEQWLSEGENVEGWEGKRAKGFQLYSGGWKLNFWW